MMSTYASRSKAPKPAVILWDRGDINGWNLTLVLQMANCQVHSVGDLQEALNLMRTAQATGRHFACLVMRSQYLDGQVAKAIGAQLENIRNIPVVVLKAHAEVPLPVLDDLLAACRERVLACSPMTMLETLAPLLEKTGAALAADRQAI